MTTQIRKAITLMERLHEGQTRKHSDIPYSTHPIAVANALLSDEGYTFDNVPMHTHTEDRLMIGTIAALMHDVLEDSPQVKNRPDKLVSLLIEECDLTPNQAALVTEIVMQVTSLDKIYSEVESQNRKERKELMQQRVYFMSLPALIIKLLDRMDNLKTLHELGDFADVYKEESKVLLSNILQMIDRTTNDRE
jgi:(p)ppGpp synthase/HD superfamily hydrolase